MPIYKPDAAIQTGATSFDVAIAGAGLVGLASAWMLHRAGYRVAVIEAGRVGQEASWAGGGILFPVYPWKYPAPVQTLAQRGRVLYSSFCNEVDAVSGVDSQYRQTGLYVLSESEFGASKMWCDANDEPLEWPGPRRLDYLQPRLMTSQAAYLPAVAQVRNPRLCRSVHAALVAEGVCIVDQSPVTNIAQQGGQFIGFETGAGVVHADRGVVAAGAWTAGLLAPWCDLPIYPVKGQMILLRGAPNQLNRILFKDDLYAIPRADGRVLVGSTLEDTGFDQSLNCDASALLHAAAADMMPALGKLPLERQWTGLRPATSDEVPYIGAVPSLGGLYVNAGHYRNGVVCAPASAEILLQCLESPDDVSVTAYMLAR